VIVIALVAGKIPAPLPHKRARDVCAGDRVENVDVDPLVFLLPIRAGPDRRLKRDRCRSRWILLRRRARRRTTNLLERVQVDSQQSARQPIRNVDPVVPLVHREVRRRRSRLDHAANRFRQRVISSKYARAGVVEVSSLIAYANTEPASDFTMVRFNGSTRNLIGIEKQRVCPRC